MVEADTDEGVDTEVYSDRNSSYDDYDGGIMMMVLYVTMMVTVLTNTCGDDSEICVGKR